ncbi:MAG: hypothetical protein ACRDA3_06140 [Peptostreptococcaceae bacterium]
MKSKKYTVSVAGILLGIIGFIFTQLWFILGMGIALCIASLVVSEK